MALVAYPVYAVRLPPSLVGRIQAQFLDVPNSAYADLSAFLVVAAENQFAFESIQRAPGVASGSNEIRSELSRLSRPESADVLLVEPVQTSQPFFMLTNRLSPMALAARVLLNCYTDGSPPKLDLFVDAASRTARQLGERIKHEDQMADASRGAKRSTGWPVGNSIEKSFDRFRVSFLLSQEAASQGPFAELGLAAVTDGRVALTHLGLEVAMAPSPLLAETQGWTLGIDQQKLLQQALLHMPGERLEIQLFLSAVFETSGDQSKVDVLLRTHHSDWSDSRAASERAGMVGRLREAGVITVEGWGPKTRIAIPNPDSPFANAILDEGKSQ